MDKTTIIVVDDSPFASKQIKYLNIKSRQNKQFPACSGGMISIHPLSLLNPDRIPVIIILHDTAR